MTKYTTILMVCLGVVLIAPAFAVCKRCIEVREQNASQTNPYFYYEDYVQAQRPAQR